MRPSYSYLVIQGSSLDVDAQCPLQRVRKIQGLIERGRLPRASSWRCYSMDPTPAQPRHGLKSSPAGSFTTPCLRNLSGIHLNTYAPSYTSASAPAVQAKGRELIDSRNACEDARGRTRPSCAACPGAYKRTRAFVVARLFALFLHGQPACRRRRQPVLTGIYRA